MKVHLEYDHFMDKELLITEIVELKRQLLEKSLSNAITQDELDSIKQRFDILIEKLESQVEWARDLHNHLVPREIPTLPGFEVSTKYIASSISSGDYFDIINQKKFLKSGLLLSSSSGPAVSAYFLSLMLSWTDQKWNKGQNPKELLEEVIQEVQPQMKGEQSAHLLYFLINRANLQLEYSSVGRLYFWHLEKGGELNLLISPKSPVDSLWMEAIDLQKVGLKTGDRLIVCTEGLMDSIDSVGQSFGEEGIKKVLLKQDYKTVHDLKNEILFAHEQFAGRGPYQRDITLIVLEVKERLIKLAAVKDE